MTAFLPGSDFEALIDDVVAVELTVDGVLVVADRLGISDFPPVLGIRLNIPFPDLRAVVWNQVTRDLTAQGVLTAYGDPHPAVADMLDTLNRPERCLEGRWWRRDAGGDMIRFAICRRGGRHVIAVRRGDLIGIQRVAGKVGLAAMVTTVLGPGRAAEVEPLTGLAARLAECRTADQLSQFDITSASARTYAALIGEPDSWVEIIARQRHSGGTVTQTDVAAGVLDGPAGRIVSIPRRVSGELYGSFLAGSESNLQRALDGLLEFLPARSWWDSGESAGPGGS